MKTESTMHSRLYKLARMFFPFKRKVLLLIVGLSLGFTSAIAQDVTQVTVTPSSNPACSSTGVTFSVTVGDQTNNANIPTGTVQLVVDGGASGTAVTLVNGTATLTPSPALSA